MRLLRTIVGKLWLTMIGLVAVVMLLIGFFLFTYIEASFPVLEDYASYQEMQLYVKKLFVVVAVIGFSMTTFFAFFLLNRITRPLLKLKKAAGLITAGQLGAQVPLSFSDEMGELVHSFNQMSRQLAETVQALQQEKEHVNSVLRSMGDAVITFDVRGFVLLVNPLGEQLLREWSELDGWESDQLDALDDSSENGSFQLQRVVISSRVPSPLRAWFQKVMDQPVDIHTKVHVKDDVWSVVLAPLYVHAELRGVVAVLRNMTEEHRQEKLRQDFLANISHELRTPLSMFQGYSEALLDDIVTAPEQQKELVQVIHDESLRMGRLVHELLDLAKLESGRLELHLLEVDIAQLGARMQRKFAVRANEQQIELICTLPQTPLWLQADEDRLEQVLTNLLDNAFRHTPSGRAIYLIVQEESNKKEAVMIQVSDEGSGISSQDLPFIFDRFYKADKARTREGAGGTGLGLAIVKNIVEAHGGTITVESKQGQGATFTIRLPLQ